MLFWKMNILKKTVVAAEKNVAVWFLESYDLLICVYKNTDQHRHDKRHEMV